MATTVADLLIEYRRNAYERGLAQAADATKEKVDELLDLERMAEDELLKALEHYGPVRMGQWFATASLPVRTGRVLIHYARTAAECPWPLPAAQPVTESNLAPEPKVAGFKGQESKG